MTLLALEISFVNYLETSNCFICGWFMYEKLLKYFKLCINYKRFNLNKKLSTIVSKINVTPNGVYLPFSKLLSILPVAISLAHNNISQICYCGQISLQSAAVNCSFSENLTPFGVTFILLAMVLLISTLYDFNLA